MASSRSTDFGRLGNRFREAASNPINLLIWVVFLAVALPLCLNLLNWGLLDARWSGESKVDCPANGACWFLVGDWFGRLIFGRYPDGQLWRPLLAGGLLFALVALTASGRLRPSRILALCVRLLILATWLLAGGPGFKPVPTSLWGGLTLTLYLTLASAVAALPISIVLALGLSKDLPVIRWFVLLFCWLFRSVPPIVLLIIAASFPFLLLHDTPLPDRTMRIALVLGCIMAAHATALIGIGLEQIPAWQMDVARSLGLSSIRSFFAIRLPQALNASLEGLFIRVSLLLLDTALVSWVGAFDLLGIVNVAATHPDYLGHYLEFTLVAAGLYLLLSFGLRALGARAARNHNKAGLPVLQLQEVT